MRYNHDSLHRTFTEKGIVPPTFWRLWRRRENRWKWGKRVYHRSAPGKRRRDNMALWSNACSLPAKPAVARAGATRTDDAAATHATTEAKATLATATLATAKTNLQSDRIKTGSWIVCDVPIKIRIAAVEVDGIDLNPPP